MKKFLLVLFTITILLLAGCSGETGSKKTAKAEKYSGFMDFKAGQWAEVMTKQGSDKVTTRTEILESSPSILRMQIITTTGDEKTISQFTYDREKERPAKFVVKQGNDVICMDAAQMSRDLMPDEGDKYDAEKAGISHGSYETPTGKTVQVAKFSTSSGETWVSSEVPFGVVKIMKGEKTLSSLYDFGTIGAKSLIDQEDIDNCQNSALTAGYVSEEIYDTYDDYEEDATVYEEYVEEEKDEEDNNFDTTTKEMGTGTQADMACSDCDSMPPMAKSACLAACN